MPAAGHEVVLTVDVEWAHPEVLGDVVSALDERGLRATFFCTHDGISVPGHERALHPNFRRHDDAGRGDGAVRAPETDTEYYRRVVATTHAFCPEAVGVRSHSLFFDRDLLSVYRAEGLQYESSTFLPLTHGLGPVWLGSDILELPLYYMDHWDLVDGVTGFDLQALRLEEPGLKLVDFHPNLVYLNAMTHRDYLDSKPRYRDPEWLRRNRRRGRGVRTLFHELLDWLTERPPPPVLGELNERARTGLEERA